MPLIITPCQLFRDNVFFFFTLHKNRVQLIWPTYGYISLWMLCRWINGGNPCKNGGCVDVWITEALEREVFKLLCERGYLSQAPFGSQPLCGAGCLQYVLHLNQSHSQMLKCKFANHFCVFCFACYNLSYTIHWICFYDNFQVVFYWVIP